MKKFISGTIIMSFLLISVLAVPAAATAITYIEGNPNTHPFALCQNRTLNTAQQVRLNCYTSSKPKAGTKVCTYINTNDATQWWGVVSTDGGDVIANCENGTLGLDINRTQATPELHVWTIIGNESKDMVLSETGDGGNSPTGGSTFSVVPKGIHTSRMYIQITSSAVSNSGGGYFCRWATSGSKFYDYDIGWNEFGRVLKKV